MWHIRHQINERSYLAFPIHLSLFNLTTSLPNLLTMKRVYSTKKYHYKNTTSFCNDIIQSKHFTILHAGIKLRLTTHHRVLCQLLKSLHDEGCSSGVVFYFLGNGIFRALHRGARSLSGRKRTTRHKRKKAPLVLGKNIKNVLTCMACNKSIFRYTLVLHNSS